MAASRLVNQQRLAASRLVNHTGRTEPAAQVNHCNQFVAGTAAGHIVGSSRTASSFGFDRSSP